MAITNNVTYKITVKTSEYKDRDSETSTDILITIFGNEGQTKPLSLNLDKDNNNKDFEIEDSNVGTLSKINLSHSISEGGVLIEAINITKDANSKSIPVNKWLEASGEKSIDISIATSEANPASKPQNPVKKPTSAKTVDSKGSKNTKKSEAQTKNTVKNASPNNNNFAAKKYEKPTSEVSYEDAPISRKKVREQKLETLQQLYYSNKHQTMYSNQNVLSRGPSRFKVMEISASRQARMKPENKPIKSGDFELATHVELKRVKTKLYKEVSKIKYPRRKDYHPFVFNDLTPYSETRLAENLISSSEYNAPLGHCNRFTAMTIVEPWVSHRMEHTIGPLVSRSLTHNARNKVSSKKLNQPGQYEGSTLAPNFPKVVIKKPKGMNGPFYYDDVEIIRAEFQKNFKNKARFEEDRNRTINDYYRMNLDQTAESLHMTGAYNAYLKNTPGSKKALEELLAKA